MPLLRHDEPEDVGFAGAPFAFGVPTSIAVWQLEHQPSARPICSACSPKARGLLMGVTRPPGKAGDEGEAKARQDAADNSKEGEAAQNSALALAVRSPSSPCNSGYNPVIGSWWDRSLHWFGRPWYSWHKTCRYNLSGYD